VSNDCISTHHSFSGSPCKSGKLWERKRKRGYDHGRRTADAPMDTPPREQTPQSRVYMCTRSGCTPAKRTLLETSPAKCNPKMEGGSVLFRNTATHLPKYPPIHPLPTTHLPTYLSNVGKFSHSWASFYLTTFISCGSGCKLLDKPTDISTYHTTRLFVTVFIGPQHQTPSRARRVLLTFSHAIHCHLKIEPAFHLHLGLVRGH